MNRYRKIILLSLKIGIGSSLALYLAEYLGLDYVVSAGTITLLTWINRSDVKGVSDGSRAEKEV